MYIWNHEWKYYWAALNNCKDHKAGAVFTRIELVLNDFMKEEKNMVNIISDSPTLQYGNETIFWIIQSCAKEQTININWGFGMW